MAQGMKTISIDYAYNAGSWSSSVVVHNKSDREDVFEAKIFVYFDKGGNVYGKTLSVRPLYKTLGPGDSWILRDIKNIVNPNKWYAIILSGPVDMEAVASMVNSGGGYGFLPQMEAETLSEAILQNASNPLNVWPGLSCPYDEFLGNCRYLKFNQMAVLRHIFQIIYYEYPDRNDRAIRVYDACAEYGQDCPGHPAGSHNGMYGNSVDLAYYTLDINHTQGQGAARIWLDESDPNSVLIAEKGKLILDVERNNRLFELIRLYFPESRSRVDARIKNVLSADIRGDDPLLYNHHLHSHNVLGDVINWGAMP